MLVYKYLISLNLLNNFLPKVSFKDAEMRKFGENPKRAGTVSGRLYPSAFLSVERELAIGES